MGNAGDSLKSVADFVITKKIPGGHRPRLEALWFDLKEAVTENLVTASLLLFNFSANMRFAISQLPVKYIAPIARQYKP